MRTPYILASGFWLLAPAPAPAMAPIMLADPGFLSYAFFTVPLWAAAGVALLETIVFTKQRRDRGALSLFATLFAGTAVGMAWAILLLILLFFLVARPILNGPDWLGFGAYWYYAGIHAYLLIAGKRWTARRYAKGLDLLPFTRAMWLTNGLCCFTMYLFLYLDLMLGL